MHFWKVSCYRSISWSLSRSSSIHFMWLTEELFFPISNITIAYLIINIIAWHLKVKMSREDQVNLFSMLSDIMGSFHLSTALLLHNYGISQWFNLSMAGQLSNNSKIQDFHQYSKIFTEWKSKISIWWSNIFDLLDIELVVNSHWTFGVECWVIQVCSTLWKLFGFPREKLEFSLAIQDF